MPLVQGGQGKQILAITHNRTATANALQAFVHGVNGAFLVGGGLTLAAAFVACFGLAHMRVGAAPHDAPEGEGPETAEQPPAVVEM